MVKGKRTFTKEFKAQFDAYMGPRRHLRRQDSEGGQAGRAAGPAADEVRVGRRPQDGEGAGPDDPAVGAPESGRGYSVIWTRQRSITDETGKREVLRTVNGPLMDLPLSRTGCIELRLALLCERPFPFG